MNRTIYTSLAALLAMALFGQWSAVQAGEPDFPPPPNARTTSAAQSTQANGLVMKIREFSTDDELDDVRRFYQKEWAPSRDDPGMVETQAMRPWVLLTRVENDYLMTVQMQPSDAGGTWGYLAISKVPEPGKPNKAPEPPPSMRGTEVVSSNASRDPGQRGETFVLVNTYSVASNLNFYRAQYAGWRTDMDRSLKEGRMHVLAFRKGRERVNITIFGDHGKSQVVVNAVHHDLL